MSLKTNGEALFSRLKAADRLGPSVTCAHSSPRSVFTSAQLSPTVAESISSTRGNTAMTRENTVFVKSGKTLFQVKALFQVSSF